MENNLINEAIDKIKSLKVDIPNIAIVLGSGLGNFIHWIENPTFVNFEEIPGFQPSTAPSHGGCLLYTSPSPRDLYRSRMPSSA